MLPVLFILIALTAQASGVYADDYYLCASPRLKEQTPLVVKYSGSVATEVLFVYKRTDRADSYQIKHRDDIFYLADEVSSDAPDAFASLKINRLSGELEVTSRISKEAVQLLANICDKKYQVGSAGIGWTR